MKRLDHLTPPPVTVCVIVGCGEADTHDGSSTGAAGAGGSGSGSTTTNNTNFLEVDANRQAYIDNYLYTAQIAAVGSCP